MALDQRGFEEEVLGFICDDYEAASTITKDMSRELDMELTEPEVRAALISLAERGMAFCFRSGVEGLVPVSVDVARLEADPWFIAKPEWGGRADKAI